MAKQTRKWYGVSPEKFVLAWRESRSTAEVGKKLGIPINCVHARAWGYRRRGVRLRPFSRPCRRIDAEALNRLLENETADQ